jgi:hypothetical protein
LGGLLVTSGISYIKNRFYELTTLRSEKAATLKELAELKQFLSEPQRKAVDKGVVTQATVVRTVIRNRETIHPDGKLCEDWVDPDGRFFWHAETRTLDVTQLFNARTSIVETESGRVYADVKVVEVNRRGVVLREVATEQAEILLAGHGRHSRGQLLIGAYAAEHSLGERLVYGPLVRGDFRIFGGVVVGAEASSDIRIFAGWRKEF